MFTPMLVFQFPPSATVWMSSSNFDRYNFKCIHTYIYNTMYICIYFAYKNIYCCCAGLLLFRSDDTKEQQTDIGNFYFCR